MSMDSDSKFIAWYAVYITTIGMLFVFLVTFVSVPKENQQNASMALGFVLGTLLAAPIGFFYGQSKRQANPNPPPLGVIPTGQPDDPVATKEVKA